MLVSPARFFCVFAYWSCCLFLKFSQQDHCTRFLRPLIHVAFAQLVCLLNIRSDTHRHYRWKLVYLDPSAEKSPRRIQFCPLQVICSRCLSSSIYWAISLCRAAVLSPSIVCSFDINPYPHTVDVVSSCLSKVDTDDADGDV